jgi:prevent-host-death family protein
MRSVGIKVLKNKLSEYVRIAEKGETVQVTDRGRVVAELVPPKAKPKKLSDAEFIARGTREGWLKPATNPRAGPPPRAPIPGLTLEELLKDLDESRADRDLP